MTDNDIARIVAALFESNWLWRLIGKRRKLTRDMTQQLDEAYKNIMIFKDINELHYKGRVEIYCNIVRAYDLQYYDVQKYKNLIEVK